MTHHCSEPLPVPHAPARLYELAEDLLENESFHASRRFGHQLNRAALPVTNKIR